MCLECKLCPRLRFFVDADLCFDLQLSLKLPRLVNGAEKLTSDGVHRELCVLNSWLPGSVCGRCVTKLTRQSDTVGFAVRISEHSEVCDQFRRVKLSRNKDKVEMNKSLPCLTQQTVV